MWFVGGAVGALMTRSDGWDQLGLTTASTQPRTIASTQPRPRPGSAPAQAARPRHRLRRPRRPLRPDHEQAHTHQHAHRATEPANSPRVALTPEAEVVNVPDEASFPASGSFPSHQLWNSPIEFFRPSSGPLYSQICQKYDFQAVSCVGTPGARRTDPPRPTMPVPTSARRIGTNLTHPPIHGGLVLQRPLGEINHEHPSQTKGVTRPPRTSSTSAHPHPPGNPSPLPPTALRRSDPPPTH